MTWTFTTSGAAIFKAGDNVAPFVSGAKLDNFSDYAEGRIIQETRRDWLTYYSSLNSGAKWLLADIASSIVAKLAIAYEPSRYGVGEAQFLMNVHDDIVNDGLRIMKDFKSNEIKVP